MLKPMPVRFLGIVNEANGYRYHNFLIKKSGLPDEHHRWNSQHGWHIADEQGNPVALKVVTFDHTLVLQNVQKAPVVNVPAASKAVMQVGMMFSS